jgi:hypothetical protein
VAAVAAPGAADTAVLGAAEAEDVLHTSNDAEALLASHYVSAEAYEAEDVLHTFNDAEALSASHYYKST